MPLDLSEEQFNGLTDSEKRVFKQNDDGFSLAVSNDFFKNSDDVTNTLNAKRAEKDEHNVTKEKLRVLVEKSQGFESKIADLELLGSKND